MKKRILGAPRSLVILAVVATLAAAAADLALGMRDDLMVSLIGGAVSLVVIFVLGGLSMFPDR